MFCKDYLYSSHAYVSHMDHSERITGDGGSEEGRSAEGRTDPSSSNREDRSLNPILVRHAKKKGPKGGYRPRRVPNNGGKREGIPNKGARGSTATGGTGN